MKKKKILVKFGNPKIMKNFFLVFLIKFVKKNFWNIPLLQKKKNFFTLWDFLNIKLFDIKIVFSLAFLPIINHIFNFNIQIFHLINFIKNIKIKYFTFVF